MTTFGKLAALPAPSQERSGWPWNVETAAPNDVETIAWPKISIVVPSFQQAAYLEETLRSIILQNYPNLELIVNDGGSKDGSREIISRYAPHIAHWQSAPDRGQGDAINQGFDRATGDIFGWLNSDDFYLPGALFTVARCFSERSGDVVYGDALNLHGDDGDKLEYWQGYWVHKSFLHFGGLLPSHATFWRKTVHERIDEKLNCNVDGELWHRLIPGRQVRYIPQPLAVFRIHRETKSQGEQWRQKWREDDRLIWERHGAPRLSRLFRTWFNRSQRVFQWFNRRRNVPAKRAVIAACQWRARIWLGRTP